MKRSLKGFISIAVIIAILGVAVTAFANSKSIEAVFKNIKISIDGKQVTNMDAEPFIYNNRTFVPVRFVIDNLGMKVNYNNATDTVEITGNSTPITTDSSNTVVQYKNNLKEFFYISDLKKIIDDLTTVSNSYIEKTDAYVFYSQNNISYPINFNLIINQFNTTQTLNNSLTDKYPGIEVLWDAQGSLITKKQIADFKTNIGIEIDNVTTLINKCNNYTAISNVDNKNFYRDQSKLTLNMLAADANIINKYYDQLINEIKK